MKKIVSIILTILILCWMIPEISVQAADRNIPITAETLCIDIDGSITSGYPEFQSSGYTFIYDEMKKGDTIRNTDIQSITSSDSTIASVTRSDSGFSIKGIKKGDATISIKVEVNERIDENDPNSATVNTLYEFKYPVHVTDAFSNVTFTYDYDKVTVNYDASDIPAGYKPVFSMDGQTWTESATFKRDINKYRENTIYKAYKINGVVTGSIKMLQFDVVVNESNGYFNKDVEMHIGDTYDTKDDMTLTNCNYNTHLINGRNNITFDENELTFTANDSGNTKLTIISASDLQFNANGAVSSHVMEYNYKIKVLKDTDESHNNTASDSSESNSGNGNSSIENNQNNIEDSSNSSNTTDSNNSSEKSPNSAPQIQKTEGTWKNDGTGWWFELTDGTYPVWDWKYIDNGWYFFDRNGYMESNGYRFGCWIGSDGKWNYDYSNGTWKNDDTGWWYEDNGWYPTSQWLKIDGYWYYFKADGYMAASEWVGNYYMTSNGTMATNCYIGQYWVGADGAWVQ